MIILSRKSPSADMSSCQQMKLWKQLIKTQFKYKFKYTDRKEPEKMYVSQLIDSTMKIQENMISGQNELFNENKKMNQKVTDI